VACPKITSKIVSDLNRESSWDILKNNGYEKLDTVALDHMWNAMRYKRNMAMPIVVVETKVEMKADFEKV
jgi:hypothetical protein